MSLSDDPCGGGVNGLPRFTDLVRVLASYEGIEPGEKSAGFITLSEEIAPGGVIVFVLIDGLGEGILERLGPESVLARHRRRSLLSVFPSTTACAMTTLATGLEPAEHGIPGRYMYLPERRTELSALAFRARSDGSPVSGIPLDRIWPYPSIMPRMPVHRFSVMPEALAGSPFAGYLCGDSAVEGYSSIPDAVDRTLRAEKSAPEPSYIFLYIWELDSLCHAKGPSHEDSLSLLKSIDGEMGRLFSDLRPSARLVISADHGQIDVGEGNRRLLFPGHPLMDSLAALPFGEPRAAQFLLKAREEKAFLLDFERSLGDSFSLFRMDSAEALSLFGGGSPSRFAQSNFGDYLALARGRDLIIYEDARHKPAAHRGEHGGDLPAERLVPLILR